MSDAMIQRLESLLEQGQDNALLRFGLGSSYYEQKDYEQALGHLIICVKQDPTQSAAWKLLGRSHQFLQQTEQAVQALQQGLAVAQENGDKQVEREITVFLNKLEVSEPGS